MICDDLRSQQCVPEDKTIKMRRHLVLEALSRIGIGTVWLVISYWTCNAPMFFHRPPNLTDQLIGVVFFLGGIVFCVLGLKRLAKIVRTSRGGLQAEADFTIPPHFEGTITRVAGHGRCMIAVGTQSKNPIEISMGGPSALQFKPRGHKTIQVARGVNNIEPFHYFGDVSRPWEVSIKVARTKNTEGNPEAQCRVQIYGIRNATELKHASSTGT